MQRVILHVDMDAFFAAVEQRDNPELRGKPVVVGAAGNERGVIAAASYEARRFGIHSAMPSREAYRRCPDAVFLPGNYRRYSDISRQIRGIFNRFTPLVEPISVDEAFLDVTGSQRLFGNGEQMARQIKAAIRNETQLTGSAGIAPNKFLAKLASDMDKPDGLTVVPTDPEAIAAFLAPLPVKRIWGVGKVMQRHLAEVGIHTVADIQACDHSHLSQLLGQQAATHLRHLAYGEDDRPVETEHEEKSISHEYTFAHDCNDRDEIRTVLIDLVDNVGSRLRAAGKLAALARIKLRWQGFETITRQRPIAPPSCDDVTLRALAHELFDREELIKPVRLVGFGVGALTTEGPAQLSLFMDDEQKRARDERLSHVVDAIRRDFGTGSIRRGSSQGHTPRSQR